MIDATNIVILFATSSHAIRAERLLKECGVDAKLTVVPRQLSSDCGLCVQVSAQLRDQVDKVIRARGITYDSLQSI